MMHIFRLTVSSLALLIATSSFAKPAAWNPKKTWVFAVGVIEFLDPRIGTFPQYKRRDVELMALLKEKGVPPEQLVYLKDAEAPLAKIQSSFRELLAKTSPGDTLFVYYTGHGSAPTTSLQTQFIAYDYDAGQDLSWDVSEIIDEIEARFRGEQVFLTADACYTGSLCNEAASRTKSRLSYGCLTSASSRNLSTGNWTFTESLISGFSGKRYADLNQDGSIDWSELVSLAELDMGIFESQMSGSRMTNKWAPSFSWVATEQKPLMMSVGDRVQHQETLARVIDSADARQLLDYVGSPKIEDAWIGKSNALPAPVSKDFPVGTQVAVEWEGRSREARVLAVGNYVYKVRFTDDSLEEWVGSYQVGRSGAIFLRASTVHTFRPKVPRHFLQGQSAL